MSRINYVPGDTWLDCFNKAFNEDQKVIFYSLVRLYKKDLDNWNRGVRGHVLTTMSTILKVSGYEDVESLLASNVLNFSNLLNGFGSTTLKKKVDGKVKTLENAVSLVSRDDDFLEAWEYTKKHGATLKNKSCKFRIHLELMKEVLETSEYQDFINHGYKRIFEPEQPEDPTLWIDRIVDQMREKKDEERIEKEIKRNPIMTYFHKYKEIYEKAMEANDFAPAYNALRSMERLEDDNSNKNNSKKIRYKKEKKKSDMTDKEIAKKYSRA